MAIPGIEEKVAFLSRRETYPGCVRPVETKQTHMSWVFLTDTRAWKLKKPVRYEYLDFSTPEARRRDCEREVRLNRRLASDVYHGVVPLVLGRQGRLQLGGQGEPVDWLVCMRRLPADRMLDQVIAWQGVTAEDIIKVASVLAAFYKMAPPIHITGAQYRKGLAAHLEAVRSELTKAEYGLSANLVESTINSQSKFIQQNSALLDDRVQSGKVIEAHGDLRPEHICLEHRPVIIDCLEFNRDFRILDSASELSFLALECERLGAPDVGALVLKTCCEQAGDRPSGELLAFYKSYHACIRAKIAVWHIKDESAEDRPKWTEKARVYLERAGGMSAAA